MDIERRLLWPSLCARSTPLASSAGICSSAHAVGRAVLVLLRLYNAVLEVRYAPGGKGYEHASKEFVVAANLCGSGSTIAMIRSE